MLLAFWSRDTLFPTWWWSWCTFFLLCLQEESYGRSIDWESEKAGESNNEIFPKRYKWRWSCFTCWLFFLHELQYIRSKFENQKVWAHLFSFRQQIFKFLLTFSLYLCLFFALLHYQNEEKRFAVYLNGRCIDCKTLFIWCNQSLAKFVGFPLQRSALQILQRKTDEERMRVNVCKSKQERRERQR